MSQQSQLLIQCSHLYQSFGSLELFEDVSFSINRGDIFALIGENGSGKTTLLQLLLGTISPDSGQCSRAPNLTIGVLPQEVVLPDPGISVRAYLEEGRLSELERQMAACLEDSGKLADWAELHEVYEHLGGYNRIPIEEVLCGLKLEGGLLDLLMERLSSGQRIRVALAKALIANPDLLLLDEPTNHLDAEMVEWLERVLRERKGASLIVSHDRKFLILLCNRLIEIKNGKLSCYGGNYDFYVNEQQRLLERQVKAYEAQEEERDVLRQKIKAMTFSKGKVVSPKDRNIMAYDHRGEQHQKSLQRNLDGLKARLAEIEEVSFASPKAKEY